MNSTARIAIACFMGALIGTLIALQLGYLWPIGALVGGHIAYLGFNFEEVLSAIPRAWQEVSEWEPDRELWREKLRSGIGAFGMGLTMLVVLCFIPMTPSFTMAPIWALTIAPAFWFLVAFMITDRRDNGNINSAFPMSFKHSNPIGVAFWTLYGLTKLIIWLPKGAMKMTRFIGRVTTMMWKFTTTLFHIIHSDLRLLCAVDAGLGTVIGYMSGNALVGAIAGALLGVLNYEIVSVRVLQVAGAKSIFR